MFTHALYVARWSASLAILGFGFAWLPTANAGGPAAGQGSAAASSAETVDMFAAIDAGKLEARIIPRDSKKARIFLENKTKTPLSVRLPATFAGVPVLAQQLNGLMGGPSRNNQMQSAQTIGGPMNGPGQNPPRQNVFNIPPEKVGEIRVDCVCLEYGKPDPCPIMPYKLVPLASVASSQTVALLEEFGNGRYTQHTIQAAAWHLTNNMSWEKLASVQGQLVSLNVYESYFSKQELSDAQSLVVAAEKKAPPSAASSTASSASTGESQAVAAKR